MPSVIFAGDKVKALKNRMSLLDNMDILYVTSDPLSVAVNAPAGSIISYNGFLYRKKDAGSSTNVELLGASSGSDKNYFGLANIVADFNGTLTGWNKLTTSMTGINPTGAPTVGSAASVTTFGVSATNPLSGTHSMNIASSGAWSAGQGYITDAFTLEEEDKGQLLTFEISYRLNSSTANLNLSGTTSNTFAVWFYNVTDSVWEPGTGQFSMTGTQGKISCQMQTVWKAAGTSAQYRVALVAINASSGAVDLTFDSASFGPTKVTKGAVVTEWKAATYTSSWGATNVNYTGGVYQHGDRQYFDVSVNCTGAPSGSALLITLPNGASIDTSKQSFVAGVTVVGRGIALDFATNGYPVIVYYESPTTVRISAQSNSGSYDTTLSVTPSLPFTFGNQDAVKVWFDAPIVGLSGTTALSSDSGGALIVASAYRITSGQTITTGAAQEVVFNAKAEDTAGSGFNTTTGRFTAPESGYYRFSYGIRAMTGATPTSQSFSYVMAGGTGVRYGYGTFTGAGANLEFPMSGSGKVHLTAGQYVSVWVETLTQNITVTHSAAGNQVSYFSIEKLASPQTVATAPSVSARYSTAAGDPMPSGATATIINFVTKSYDSHNAVTVGAAWKFTAPISGKYEVISNVRYENVQSWAAGSYVDARLYKNGSIVSDCDTLITTSITPGQGPSAQMVDKIKLLAGDYIDIRSTHGEATTRNLVAYGATVFVTIDRVGEY
jgi:hypothetical protein